MFCTKCGTPNENNSKFCCGCGEPLAQQSEPVNNNPAPGETTPVADYQQQNNYGYQQQQNYGYQQPNSTYNAPYKAPITGKNIAKCIVLTIVTCGIYGIIWFINLVDDLNTAAQTPEDSSGVSVFLLGLVTCGIYYFIWFYKAGEKVNKVKSLSGQYASDSAILYLLLAVFGLSIVNYVLIQSELNKVAATQE